MYTQIKKWEEHNKIKLLISIIIFIFILLQMFITNAAEPTLIQHPVEWVGRDRFGENGTNGVFPSGTQVVNGGTTRVEYYAYCINSKYGVPNQPITYNLSGIYENSNDAISFVLSYERKKSNVNLPIANNTSQQALWNTSMNMDKTYGEGDEYWRHEDLSTTGKDFEEYKNALARAGGFNPQFDVTRAKEKKYLVGPFKATFVDGNRDRIYGSPKYSGIDALLLSIDGTPITLGVEYNIIQVPIGTPAEPWDYNNILAVGTVLTNPVDEIRSEYDFYIQLDKTQTVVRRGNKLKLDIRFRDYNTYSKITQGPRVDYVQTTIHQCPCKQGLYDVGCNKTGRVYCSSCLGIIAGCTYEIGTMIQDGTYHETVNCGRRR